MGVLSSRQIALAGARHVALMAIVGANRPDFRTISDCRTLPLDACKAVCVQVGRCAGAAGWVTCGNGSTDGTNIQGHASRHTAMSDG